MKSCSYLQNYYIQDKFIGFTRANKHSQITIKNQNSQLMSNNSTSQGVNLQKNVSQFKRFIQSNQSYLQQKYHQHFYSQNDNNEENKIKLTLLPIQKLLSYIYEIFSLQKYAKNKKVNNAIQTSIQQNLKQYLMELDPNSLSKNNQLTFDKLKDILIYIIQHNSIFAVQYEVKHKNQVNKNVSSNKNLNIQVEVSLENQNGNVIDDDQIKNYDSSMMSYKKNDSNFDNSFIENQFDVQQSSQTRDNYNNQKLIKKNAKALFDFYCRQQMELGGVITFDRLNQQTSSMSLGKCLTFAKAMNLYNSFIKRQDFISKFKKVSEGKKYIDFDKFQAMLSQFQVMDPNFNQRVGLLSEDIRKVLKYVKLPFNTKDIQPRQRIAVRNFSSRLTEHGGQTSQALKIQLQQKKREIANMQKLRQIKQYLQWKQSRPQVIRQKDIFSPKPKKPKDPSIDLTFIGSIVHPEQADQTYLKQYAIPKLQKQTEKVSKFGKVFQTQRYQSLDKLTLRKQSVVTDIRNRIKQIQNAQKIQNSKKLIRSSIFQSNKKVRYLQK